MRDFSLNPVGTLEELRDMGLDVSRTASCAERVGGGPAVAPTVMGCPFFKPSSKKVPRCTLPCKAKGPEMVKVRTLKANGRKLERAMPCYEFYQHVFPENNQDGGNISKVVGVASADKELTYVARETQPEKFVGHNNTIKVVHKQVMVTRKIEPFVRPKDNPKFAEDSADVRMREMEEAEKVDAAWRERSGIGDGVKAFLSDDFMGKPDEEAEA